MGVKKPLFSCFLNNCLIFEYFFYENSQGHVLLYKKQHVKSEIMIIMKSEEILVLMEGT